MSAHKSIDKICIVIVAFTLILTLLFCNGQAFGIETTAHAAGYENRLFDRSRVHSVDIVIDNWDSFLETCEREEYSPCTVIIDGEAVKNAGIRGKGNTSLSSVRNSGSSRYSFKIEFDQYDSAKSYHGLDKLCLNNIIQDNTYMKDYLAYSMMYDFGVDAPLCSYAYITVNGEDWGLYLAVEAVEDSFLSRNYGSSYGDLYKPDAMSFGGGRGNGKDFSMSDFMNQNSEDSEAESSDNTQQNEQPDRSGGRPDFGNGDMPDFGNMPEMPDFGGEMPDFGGEMPDFGGKMPSSDGGKMPENFDPSQFAGGEMPGFGGGMGMGSSDVKLQYTDDEISSYSNIFNNAKTTVNTADKKRLIAALKALSEQNDLENTLDTDEVLRYFAVHIFLQNGDSYTGQMIHNYYLYEKDGRLSMIPWDYNLAFGSFMGGNGASAVNAAIDTPVSGDMSDRPMVAWIFSSEEYTEQYHRLLREFLNSNDFAAIIDETAAMIDSYVQKDPTKFCTYEEYQKGIAAIKAFCSLRAESVSGQLDGSIPSTSEGQQADSSALIDTGDLNISDMGTMGGGGGFGGRGDRHSGKSGVSGDAEQTEKSARTEKTTLTGTSALSFGRMNSLRVLTVADRPDAGGNRPDFGGRPPQGFDPGNMPEGFDPGNMPQDFDPNNAPEGFDPNNAPDGSDPNGNPEQSTDNAGEDSTAPKNEQNENAPERPDKGQGGRPQPGGSFPGMTGSETTDHTTEFILLGVSALVLLLGLGFALKFKR